MIRQSFISVILLLIVGWFLVVWDSPPESFMRKNDGELVQKRSVDSYMTGISSRRFSDAGDELFFLTSSKMELFKGESGVVLSAPRFVAVTNKAKGKDTGVSFVANIGSLSEDGRKLVLNGDVEAIIGGKNSQTTMVSDSLEYDAPNMLITTDGDFTLTTPALSVSGKGLNANLSKEIFTMNSKVRAVHEAT